MKSAYLLLTTILFSINTSYAMEYEGDDQLDIQRAILEQCNQMRDQRIKEQEDFDFEDFKGNILIFSK